jgi:hypothetical protein
MNASERDTELYLKTPSRRKAFICDGIDHREHPLDKSARKGQSSDESAVFKIVNKKSNPIP